MTVQKMTVEATLLPFKSSLSSTGATVLEIRFAVKHGPKVNADRLLTLAGQAVDLSFQPKQLKLGKKVDAPDPTAKKTRAKKKPAPGSKRQPLPQSSMKFPKGRGSTTGGKKAAKK